MAQPIVLGPCDLDRPIQMTTVLKVRAQPIKSRPPLSRVRISAKSSISK